MKKQKRMSTRDLKRQKGIDLAQVMKLYQNAKTMMENEGQYELKDVEHIANETKNILSDFTNVNKNDIIQIKTSDFTKKINSIFNEIEKEIKEDKNNHSIKINMK